MSAPTYKPVEWPKLQRPVPTNPNTYPKAKVFEESPSLHFWGLGEDENQQEDL